MQSITQNNRGFTLIEMLFYMAILVLVSGALVTTFLSLDMTIVRNQTERVLAEEARMSLETILSAVRSADSVHLGLSALNTSPGALAVVSGATTTRFFVTGDRLMLEINGVEQGPLTSSAVDIETLVFNHRVSSSSELIRVSLTLSSRSKSASTTRMFNTSAVMRGSYE